MTELNNVKKEEILIKQKRLRTIFNIERIVDVNSADVDTTDINDFTNSEKNKLILDILNILHITELDESYEEFDGSTATVIIENTVNFLGKHKTNKIISSVYDELISVISNYDISDLMDQGIILNYLKVLNSLSLFYDEIYLDNCKRI